MANRANALRTAVSGAVHQLYAKFKTARKKAKRKPPAPLFYSFIELLELRTFLKLNKEDAIRS